MKKKIKNVVVPVVVTLLFLIIYLFMVFMCFYDVMVRKNILLLILSLVFFAVPLIINLIILKKTYNRKMKKLTGALLAILLVPIFFIYLFIVLFVVALLETSKGTTNYKVYDNLYKKEKLMKKFPKSIPSNAKNIIFFYHQGVLQANNELQVYYKVDKETVDEYIKKYEKSAIWIGTIDSEDFDYYNYNISYDLMLKNVKISKDYKIYYLYGYCDDSGYCNHGKYSYVAINKKTNECVFIFNYW